MMRRIKREFHTHGSLNVVGIMAGDLSRERVKPRGSFFLLLIITVIEMDGWPFWYSNLG